MYTSSFGFNAAGALGGNGQFFAFNRHGRLTASFPVPESTPNLIGMIFQNARSVLVADLGNGTVWKIDPTSSAVTMFTQVRR